MQLLRGTLMEPNQSRRTHVVDVRRRTCDVAGELNTTGVAKYSDFGPIDGYISETVQDRR